MTNNLFKSCFYVENFEQTIMKIKINYNCSREITSIRFAPNFKLVLAVSALSVISRHFSLSFGSLIDLKKIKLKKNAKREYLKNYL